MRLSYNGARFHGWQSQPNAVSVQSAIEDAAARVFRMPVKITGAGRTDTGVNARMMVAHFDLPDDIHILERMTAGLNALCGPDIAIEGIWRVHDDATQDLMPFRAPIIIIPIAASRRFLPVSVGRSLSRGLISNL